MEPTPARYVAVKQGGKHLLDADNFEYRRIKTRETKMYYQCIKHKSLGCKGSAVVLIESDMIVGVHNEHNHDNDLLAKKIRAQEKEAIEVAATNMSTNPRTVLGNLTCNIVQSSSRGVGAMRKTGTLTKANQRARKVKFGLPKDSQNWSEMLVPDNLKDTKGGDKFLQVEESLGQLEDGEKILIFCSNQQKEVLNKANYWIADGTFDVVNKTLFSQLFVLTAESKTGITVPCLFALLPNKETLSYQRVFQFLKDVEVNPPSVSFKTDFETSIIKGFKRVYSEVDVRCCDTHFKRALRRHIVGPKCQLGQLYNSNVEFQTLVRYLWALSLVPENQVVQVWEDFLSKEFDVLSTGFQDDYEQVEMFLAYFEKTWLGSMNTRTWERRSPLFAHSLWNKYQAVLDEDVLTSNAAEGYNHALSTSLPKNASVWALVEQLRTEESSISRKLHDSVLGPENNQATAPNTSRNIKKNQRLSDLKNLVSNYYNVSTKIYMDSLINFYNNWSF
jgi:hypothetical protein